MEQNERVMEEMPKPNARMARAALACGLLVFLFFLFFLLFPAGGGGIAGAQQPVPAQSGGETETDGQGAQIPQVTGEEQATGQVYFYLHGELAPVGRQVAGGGQTAEFGMIELLKGPNEEEKAAGYVTFIPEGTKLQYSTVKMDRSEYDVNLSTELLQLSGDKDKAAKALAQIEKTLQELTGIEKIGITVTTEGPGSEPQDAYKALGVFKDGQEGEPQGGKSNAGLITGIVIAVLIVTLVAFLLFYIPRRGEAAGSGSASGKNAPKKAKAGKKAKK
jgi:hypothetical protein